MKSKKGGIALLTAAILYGFFGIFSRLIGFNLPFYYQSWVRNLFSTFIILILILFFKNWKSVQKKDLKWFTLRSLSGFVSFICTYVAFTKLDIATTYLVSFAASTIVGYILGIAVFNEGLTKTRAVALLLSILGLFQIYRLQFNPDSLLYILLATIGGMAAPGWSVFSKKISGAYSNLQINLIDALFATALPFILSIFYREPWIAISFNLIWFEAFLFSMMFLLAGFLIVYGFSKVDAQSGTLILLFEVIVGAALGYLFFNESLSFQGMLGGALILGGIILSNKKSR